MPPLPIRLWGTMMWAIAGICALSAGCHHMPAPPHDPPTAPSDLPTELAKVSLPEYKIAPPDVLVINALRVVPRPPYRIQTLDLLTIQVGPALPEQPISGIYTVEPDGNVNLGFSYGTVPVADFTVDEAKKSIEKHLKTILKAGYQVSVSLAQSRGLLQIRGEHLVMQDGTVGLGSYGSVPVAGLTVHEAKVAIETHLSLFLQRPEVSVAVSGFNSKVYYVITDGGGYGEQLVRLPITGNETVLDAVSQVNGLSAVSSKRIWVARPAPANAKYDQVLPVDWAAITQGGATATNYQILPGDRVYIQAEPLVTLDTRLARIISPIERLLGVTLLGSSTYTSVKDAGGGISATGGVP
jgi:polysaccharide export outer membrane protein